MASVQIHYVRKSFGGFEVLHGVSVPIEDGAFVVLVGPSGCGKSTLLRMLAGLENITSGTISIGDKVVNNVQPKERDIAMVFQNYALYPHMTVADNMGFSLKLRGAGKDEIDKGVKRAAEILALTPLLDRYPRQLSGGQRQRVAMGRAIVRDPQVFLFDEPLSNLDAGLRAQMRIEIGSLQRRLGTTTLYVTHDQVEAMTLGDRIVVLADRRIQQVGRPIEIYRAPVNRFVAGFIGTPPMNFVEGRLDATDGAAIFVADGARVPLLSTAAPRARTSESMTLGIRPEDLRVETTADRSPTPPDGVLSGQVVLVERLGGTSHVHLDVGTHRLLASVSTDAPPNVGDRIAVRVPPERVHLFAGDGRAVRSGDSMR